MALFDVQDYKGCFESFVKNLSDAIAMDLFVDCDRLARFALRSPHIVHSISRNITCSKYKLDCGQLEMMTSASKDGRIDTHKLLQLPIARIDVICRRLSDICTNLDSVA